MYTRTLVHVANTPTRPLHVVSAPLSASACLPFSSAATLHSPSRRTPPPCDSLKLRYMWLAILLYTVFVTTGLYTFLGFSAAVLHAGSIPRTVVVTVVSAVVGLGTAVALGAPPALIISGLYTALPYDMPRFHAILWGCGQGLVITMLNVGLFHRLL